MAGEKRTLTTLEEVKEEEARKVAGGYVGSDKYTLEEYSWAGVSWEHNFWTRDRYFVRGAPIDQEMAEKIVVMSLQRGRPLKDDELRAIGVIM